MSVKKTRKKSNRNHAQAGGKSPGQPQSPRQPSPWYKETAKPNVRLINGAAAVMVVLAILLLSVFAIQADRKREEAKKDSISFGLYLVKNMNAPQAAKIPLERLVLDSKPILSDEDLRLYRWTDQVLDLTDEEEFLKRLPDVPVHGLPFVVMVNGERIYLGSFWVSFSSLSTDLPVIDVIMSPLAIKPGYPWDQLQDPDPRQDPRVRSVLKVLGKLG